MVNNPSSVKKLFLTPLSRAANMRSVQTEASTHVHAAGSWVSVPWLAAGTSGTFDCFCLTISHPSPYPPSLSPALVSELSGHLTYGTMRALNSTKAPSLADLPGYFALASNHSIPRHECRLRVAFHAQYFSARSEFQASP
jgi:hypothetical protein